MQSQHFPFRNRGHIRGVQTVPSRVGISLHWDGDIFKLFSVRIIHQFLLFHTVVSLLEVRKTIPSRVHSDYGSVYTVLITHPPGARYRLVLGINASLSIFPDWLYQSNSAIHKRHPNAQLHLYRDVAEKTPGVWIREWFHPWSIRLVPFDGCQTNKGILQVIYALGRAPWLFRGYSARFTVATHGLVEHGIIGF